jgi:hypothetical protein
MAPKWLDIALSCHTDPMSLFFNYLATRSRDSLYRQSLIHCKQRQFQARRHSELVEDVAQVMLDGIFTDFEIFSNFLV